MFKRNKGFTMIELLVVMVIILILAAMLLPAINKGRAKASVESAKAEMASLTSTASIIMMDTGQYLRLVDYSYQRGALPAIPPATSPMDAFRCEAPPIQPTAVVSVQTATLPTLPTPPINNGYIEPSSWNGPYHTYSARDQLDTVAPTFVGSYPSYDSDADSALPAPGVNEWDNNDFPEGTPLDPWGHPYGLAWSDHNIAYGGHAGEDVMVIYSAGPDGTLHTAPGSPLPRDASGNYLDVAGYDGDDLIYKFK